MSGSWLAAQGRLPLAFIGLGLAWLVVATIMFVAQPEVLAWSHATPAVVALTHAWVLGFFVTITVGVMYQIAPVALGTTLWSERYGWWHFALHAAAVPGMIHSFLQWDMTMLGHFGSAVALGIGLFAINIYRTVGRSGQRDPVAWALVLAATWLSLTVLAGLVLTANRIWHFWGANPLALLRAHAHLGLVGFFVTLLQGVSFRLLPMFTLADVPDWRPVRAGLWCSQMGLLGLVPALAIGFSGAATVFGLLILAGLLASGWALRQTLVTRQKRALGPGLRSFVRGTAGLLLTAGLGVALVWPSKPWGSATGGFNAMVYGVVLFIGGLLPIFAGMLCKIVPFLTWMRAYGPLVGRMRTPTASALSHERIEAWGLALQSLAVVPLVVGVWRENSATLAFGACVLAFGVALFTTAMITILRHLWRPIAGADASTTRARP